MRRQAILQQDICQQTICKSPTNRKLRYRQTAIQFRTTMVILSHSKCHEKTGETNAPFQIHENNTIEQSRKHPESIPKASRRHPKTFRRHSEDIPKTFRRHSEGIPIQSIFQFQFHHTIPLGWKQEHMHQPPITFISTPVSPQAMSETSFCHPSNGVRPSPKPAQSSIW